MTALWFGKPDELGVRDAMRLLPDLLRQLKRLAADPALARQWPVTPEGLAAVRRLCRLPDTA